MTTSRHRHSEAQMQVVSDNRMRIAAAAPRKHFIWAAPLVLALMTVAVSPVSADPIRYVTGVAVGPNQITHFDEGDTWEYGNDLLRAGSSNDGSPLAVGDSIEIYNTLAQSLILTDATGEAELFRSFFLRYPDNRSVDASSIDTVSEVLFFDPTGALITTLGGVSGVHQWPYQHCSGDCALRGIHTIIAGELAAPGQSVEIAGWIYRMSVLADPNNLLAQGEWPWVTFAFRADSIQIGRELPNSPVPEPSTLLLLASGLTLPLIRRLRRSRAALRLPTPAAN